MIIVRKWETVLFALVLILISLVCLMVILEQTNIEINTTSIVLVVLGLPLSIVSFLTMFKKLSKSNLKFLKKNKYVNCLRWLNFSAGILIFVFFAGFFCNYGGNKLNLFMITGFIPSIIVSFISLFYRFYLEFIFGIWFLFISFIILSESSGHGFIISFLLVLPALILFFSPFISIVLKIENRIK